MNRTSLFSLLPVLLLVLGLTHALPSAARDMDEQYAVFGVGVPEEALNGRPCNSRGIKTGRAGPAFPSERDPRRRPHHVVEFLYGPCWQHNPWSGAIQLAVKDVAFGNLLGTHKPGKQDKREA